MNYNYPQGWECPVCGFVMNPNYPGCINQANHGRSHTSGGTNIDVSTAMVGCRHCGKLPRNCLVNNTCEDCIEKGVKIV